MVSDIGDLPLRDLLERSGGESGRLIADRDWSATPLGPMATWPASLNTALAMLILSPVPIVMLWGPDGVMLYNDGYSVFAGGRHPEQLGMKVREGWPEVLDFNENVMRVVLEGGGVLTYHDQELTLYRNNGVAEQVWMDLGYSPVIGENGRPAGVIAIVTETSDRVLGERRQAFQLYLEDILRDVGDPQATAFLAAEAVGGHLRASRVGYAELEPDGVYVVVEGEWCAPGVFSIAGRHLLASYGDVLVTAYKAGETLVVNDFHSDPRSVGTPSVDAHNGIGVRAQVVAPLIKNGALVALMFVHDAEPHVWTPGEIETIENVAERTWAAVARSRAEKALRVSEARRGAALAAARLGTFEWTIGEDTIVMDARSRQIFSFAQSGPVTTDDLFNCVIDGERQDIIDKIRHSVIGRERLETEYRIQTGDGRERTVVSLSEAVAGSSGAVEKIAGVFTDVTEERAAAEALRESDTRVRLATEAAEIGFWDVDVVKDRLFWPPSVKAMFGISPDVSVSMADFYGGLHPEDAEVIGAAYADAANSEIRALYDVEFRAVGKQDGVIRWVAAKGRGMFAADGRCLRVIGTAIDITRRKADEARLRELNETLERRIAEALAERKLMADVVDGADAIVVVLDPEYNLLAINAAGEDEIRRAFGARASVGDNLLDLMRDYPEVSEIVRVNWARALAGEEFVCIEAFRDHDRVQRHFEMRFQTLRDAAGQPIGAYQFVYEVTDRLKEQARLRDAEAALQQAQKMDAVGQLTGGIAHDFNNLLQGVSGSLDLIRLRPDDPARVKRWSEVGLEAAERGAKLTSQLLAFSRAQKLEAKPVVVDDLLVGMRDLLERTLGPLILVELVPEGSGAPVLTDAVQLEMAVLNMAINARDAMGDQGRLRIASRMRRVDDIPELIPGDYVELSVADSGVGMPPEVAARAFDPFFTTKDVGKGTGLGLSQVYGVARQAGGTATIESRQGVGTTVRLFLRRSDGEVGSGASSSNDEPIVAFRPSTVLIIDDDPAVRGFLVDSLEALGHRALQAPDGPTGLALLEKARPDVLVVDFAMPRMNGAEVARAAWRRHPDLPIVFASGYADTKAVESAAGADAHVLRKPFAVADLQAALAAALTAPARSTAAE